MAIANFPNNPNVNDIYTNENRSWTWNGRFWQATSTTVGYAGSTGYTGSTGAGYTGSVGYAGSASPGYAGSIGYSGSVGAGYTGSSGVTNVFISDSSPATPSSGYVWFNSSNGQLLVYYNGAWIQPVSLGSGSGSGSTTILNDISNQFNGLATRFQLRLEQAAVNTIVDSRELEVVVNGSQLKPYVTTYTWPWIPVYDSFNGFRVRKNLDLTNYLTIYNAPAAGSSASLVFRSTATAAQTRRYPFSATTVALGD
jgi:hypothetical protein